MIRKVKALPRYIKKGGSTLKNDGLIVTMILGLQKVQKMRAKTTTKPKAKIKFVSLVKLEDVLSAGKFPIANKLSRKATPPYTVNWVMSPPRGGGGHQNIFRFIDYLDSQGYQNNVYLYSTIDQITVKEVRENLKGYSKAKHITIQWLKDEMLPADAIFATGWETAYPVLNSSLQARRFYFVQDFEPYFYPVSTDYVLAENTYKFGFHGITAGGWLSHKLSKEYGMQCDHYNFGADPGLYSMQNHGKRKKVFFYARPVTSRRGFELGIMTLAKFHELMPDYEIILAGWDVSEYNIPFPYKNLKALPLSALNEVYNECAVALVISLTNMSLLPLEILAAGVIPVMNDGPNNTMVSNNQYIRYVSPTPNAMAKALQEEAKRKDLPQYAAKAAASVTSLSWGTACEKFEKIVQEQLSGE